jgi:WhiB family redox-sensing transcriptional regulator
MNRGQDGRVRKDRKGFCSQGHDLGKPGASEAVRGKNGQWTAVCTKCKSESGRAERRMRSLAQTERAKKARKAFREIIGVPEPRTRWQEKAACLKSSPELFFYELGEKKAKEVCAECPVSKECLAAYLFEPYGVFGGLNPSERENLRRRAYRRG